MELLSPWSLAWAGLLAPLVLLYILKRKRVAREVPSTMLWELAMRDLRAERPWKKLLVQAALVLQSLALVAGALALARPAGIGGLPRGARVVAVIDASASMAAVDTAGRSRLAEARARIAALARGLPPGGELSVILGGPEPVVACPPSRDLGEIERALSAAAVTSGMVDLEAALSLARERIRNAPAGSRIAVYTDGAFDGEVVVPATRVPLELVHLGPARADNTGIVAADVRERPTEASPDRVDVFCRIRHASTRTEEVFVTASILGRGDVASRRVLLRPGVTESVVLPADLPPDASGRAAVVRIALQARPGAPPRTDALALDDVVVVEGPASRRLPVYLVGDVPRSVARALRADDRTELFAATQEAMAAHIASGDAPSGLFVYGGAAQGARPAGVDVILVNPVGQNPLGVQMDAPIAASRIVRWTEDDPRLRFVTFRDERLGLVRPIRDAGARPLVTTDQGSVVAVHSGPSAETLVVAFDPDASDWPTRPSFVVFMRNVVERARARRLAREVEAGALGDPLRVPVPDGQRVTAKTPSGLTLEGRSVGGVAIIPTPAEPGVYEVRTVAGQRIALRNMLDARETDLARRGRLLAASSSASAATPVPTQGSAGAERREGFTWLVLGLLLVLVAEAWWATRRGAT